MWVKHGGRLVWLHTIICSFVHSLLMEACATRNVRRCGVWTGAYVAVCLVFCQYKSLPFDGIYDASHWLNDMYQDVLMLDEEVQHPLREDTPFLF